MRNLSEVSLSTLEPDTPVQESPESVALEFEAVVRSASGAESRAHHDPDLWNTLVWVLDHGQPGGSASIR